MLLFQLLIYYIYLFQELPDGYLETDPGMWGSRKDYKQAWKIIKYLQVINHYDKCALTHIQE